jgi:putative DNA methylase
LTYKKKLIEVALPLEEINAASAREKSIRHGHPSTLHLWWARRPLAAARAVIWSSLVDDPSAHPDQFPTEEAQNAERERLFDILRDLVIWENSNNKQVLEAAKAEIMKSTDGNPPPLLDPFAGGGSIPLEAQRLGLEAHASDLNPVAVMINKAMIEIPPKFANQPPVNPDAKNQIRTWEGAQGLAEDVRYYGNWMKEKAFEKIGHLYPKVQDEHGIERTVIAWIWARTIKCPNPACGVQMPLVKSFDLSKKKGKEFSVVPILKNARLEYQVKPRSSRLNGTVERSGAICIACQQPVEFETIRLEGQANHLGAELIAVVAEGQNGRIYLSPNEEHKKIAEVEKPTNYPSGQLSGKARVNVTLYGYEETSDLFTNRQLIMLTTFSNLLKDVSTKILRDGSSQEYAAALQVYLAFIIDKLTDFHSSFSSWAVSRETIRNTFGRQAIPMVWDFAEANPFSNSTGCFENMLRWIQKVIEQLPGSIAGFAIQQDAQLGNGLREVVVSTDPPYYDNIAYADLADFFYIWMRQSLGELYPSLFKTMLGPKTDELVATPYRFEGGTQEAQKFFEDGMLKAFKQIFKFSSKDYPVTVYYAYRQTENDYGDKSSSIASTGWETMLSALIQAGFSLAGTWPMRTEMANRNVAFESNALASSIVLVCRKRSEGAPTTTRRDFINTLKRELKPALQKLQASNIAPVDLAQAAIGPGMGVYSRYNKVLEADGTPMSVRTALQLINHELDVFFNEQDGELDRESRFCVELYSQAAFNEIRFGEADVLARAKNTSVDTLAQNGVLLAEKGIVRLLTREELPSLNWAKLRSSWMVTQQLTKAMESGGNQATAAIISTLPAGSVEQAKALAYRLFSIAERKGWTKEAFAYNALVNSWKDVQASAAEISAAAYDPKQTSLFDD